MNPTPSPKKFVVGLTGGIGSGKTSIANCFAELGVSLIDADLIAHSLTAPGGIAIPAIRNTFGDAIITPDGAMDRNKMRALAFSDPLHKTRLEAILHPLIRAQAEYEITQATGPYIIYVVPLLVESGNRDVSRILVVDCEEQVQVERVCARNGLTESQVRAIMANQASRHDRCAAADDIIINQGKFSELKAEIFNLHQRYCHLSGVI